MLATMDNARTFTPDYDQWEPPTELVEHLSTLTLTRDKVEAVFVVYAHYHHGQGPYASEIARILSLSKQTVENRMKDLIIIGRASRIHGKYAILTGNYTHPALAKVLKGND
jgi:hypothetical protein